MTDEKKVIVAPDVENRENLGAMPTMIAPDQVTSLEALVRHALKEAAPDSKAHMPLVQPRTLPMVQPQKLPVAPKSAPAVAVAPGVAVASPPKSVPKVVTEARPASEPPAAKSATQPPTVLVNKTPAPRRRSSALVMAFMGIVVVGCAGAAVYLAKNDRLMRAARAAHPTATARPASTEETVSFGTNNTARPPAAETAAAPVTEAAPPPAQAAAAPEAPPEEKKEEKKKRRIAKAAASEEATPKAEEKPEPKKPEPKVVVEAKPEPKKPEPKVVAEAKPEPKPEPKKPAGGVDALLQQQLNSAIP